MYKKLIEDFHGHRMKEHPRESCGLVTLDYKYIPCKNISEDPKNSFVLEPFALVKYSRNIFALCHSHPGDESPLPSRDDYHDPILNKYKFIVGNAEEVYIYWYDDNGEFIIEPLGEKHVS